MSSLTPHNVLIGLLAIVAIIAGIGAAWAIFMSRDRAVIWAWIFMALPRILAHRKPVDTTGWAEALSGQSSKPAVEIEESSEPAVDIPFAVEYGPVTLETALMTMRLTYPRLFSDDWYKESRKDFSKWVVGMSVDRRKYRRRMGLAT